MRGVLRRWKRFYGADPAHVLLVLGSFALAAYSVSFLSDSPSLTRMVIWFAGAVVLHDLVLFPGYAAADRVLTGGLRLLRRRRLAPPVPPVNHVRVPVLGSGLLFLLFFPGIVEQGSVWYRAATGQTQEPFFERWLLITATMFAASALAYALRLAIAYRSRTAARGRPKTIGAALARRGPDQE